MSKRVGQCNRCGMCCIEAWRFAYNTNQSELLPQKDLDWNLVKLLVDPKTRDIPESGKIPCPQLIQVEGVWTCKIHDKDKSEVCRRYPMFQEELIFPNCGYRFVEDDGE